MKNLSLLIVLLFITSCSLFSDKKEEKLIPEEEIIQNAERAYQNGMLKLSRQYWNELKDNYPTSYFIPLAEIKLADSYYLTSEFSEALGAYEAFIQSYPEHEAADYSLFQIGNTYIKQYRKSALDQQPLRSAIDAYNRLLQQYPSSLYLERAKSLIEKCKEGLAKHELLVAKFYTKQEDYESAANRLRYLKSKYPNSRSLRVAMREIKNEYPENFSALKKALRD